MLHIPDMAVILDATGGIQQPYHPSSICGRWSVTGQQYGLVTTADQHPQHAVLHLFTALTFVSQHITVTQNVRRIVLNPTKPLILLHARSAPSIVIYSMEAQRLVTTLTGWEATWHADGTMIAVYDTDQMLHPVCTIFTHRGEMLWRYHGAMSDPHVAKRFAMAWHPTLPLLALATVESWFILDVVEQQYIFSTPVHSVQSPFKMPLAWNAQGTHLVCATGEQCFLYHVSTGTRTIYAIPGIIEVSWHPSGTFFTVSR